MTLRLKGGYGRGPWFGTTWLQDSSGPEGKEGGQLKTKAGSPQHSARAPPAVQIPDPVMNWNPLAVRTELVVVTVLVNVLVDVTVELRVEMLVKVLVDVLVDVTVVLLPVS